MRRSCRSFYCRCGNSSLAYHCNNVTRRCAIMQSVAGAEKNYGIDIKDWRKPYINKDEPILLEENLPSKDPFEVFDVWFKNIASKTDVSFEEVNAACLSTACANRPSSRMILIKEYDKEGFSFYTNFESKKAQEIKANPQACLLFYWPKVDRQVRIEGKMELLSSELADAYWKSRPVKSRIGSKISTQSAVIPSRQFLIDKKNELVRLAEEKGGDSITRPDSWGGYRLRPDYFEFWQGQSDRIHDRIVFEKSGNEWKIKRLSP
uniref:Pyridoxine-5'-phosphate oxidase n=1 Tax=Parascaris univalens TaxID=6257 RepID=A0A915BJS4_PARUN